MIGPNESCVSAKVAPVIPSRILAMPKSMTFMKSAPSTVSRSMMFSLLRSRCTIWAWSASMSALHT